MSAFGVFGIDGIKHRATASAGAERPAFTAPRRWRGRRGGWPDIRAVAAERLLGDRKAQRGYGLMPTWSTNLTKEEFLIK
jgi:hypothetical protein